MAMLKQSTVEKILERFNSDLNSYGYGQVAFEITQICYEMKKAAIDISKFSEVNRRVKRFEEFLVGKTHKKLPEIYDTVYPLKSSFGGNSSLTVIDIVKAGDKDLKLQATYSEDWIVLSGINGEFLTKPETFEEDFLVLEEK